MPFDPSEPRVPAGGSAGGQWGAPSTAKKKSTSTSHKTPTSTKPKVTAAKGRATGKGKTPPGPARNAAAAKVQQDPKAQALYGQLLQASAGQRGAYAKGLSTDDLKLLTQMVYSSRTSDPAVVNARMAVASEMSRRGLDIKQYGALGGGLPAARVNTLRKVAVRKAGTKTVARAVPRPAPRVVPRPAAPRPAAPAPSNIGRSRAI